MIVAVDTIAIVVYLAITIYSCPYITTNEGEYMREKHARKVARKRKRVLVDNVARQLARKARAQQRTVDRNMATLTNDPMDYGSVGR
jgi:hypothetical protein